ncbi:MAG: aminotransferase class I/II-fold pyridoxal phosphate-dependent enzyme [Patescibacteria group bacterium]|nr:aminotransferase class I/II-fold pyridoxal phosphate-dependent enzyme [Patescibacteria group bacterium]
MREKKKSILNFSAVALFLSPKFRFLYDKIIRKSAKLLIFGYVICNSKNIGMAGIRIGYILTSECLAGMIEKFKPMMEVSSLAVNAIVAICSSRKYLKSAVKDIVISRGKFTYGLRDLGYNAIERGGNFILVDFGDKRKEVLESLGKNNIEYRIFGSPLKKYTRITVGKYKIMNYVLKIIRKHNK